MHYEELGLFIIIRPGCQCQLYCSPKTRCKIACFCIASIKMGVFLQQSSIFHSGREWDHNLRFFFHLNKTCYVYRGSSRQTDLVTTWCRTKGTTDMPSEGGLQTSLTQCSPKSRTNTNPRPDRAGVYPNGS